MLKASYVFLVLGLIFTAVAIGYFIFQCFPIAAILFALGLFTGIYNFFKSKPGDQTNTVVKILPIVLNTLFFIFLFYLTIGVIMFYLDGGFNY